MKSLMVSIIFIILILSTLYSDTSIGADLVSRYVWRGTDYGNAAAVQPAIETTIGPVSVGAWGSWSISPGLYYKGTQDEDGDDEMTTEASGNECDLYASTKMGPVFLTLTDYFFPAYTRKDELFNPDKHTFEFSASSDTGPLSILAAVNVSGDEDNSIYLELMYGTFTIGLGNGDYSTDGKFAPVNIGISADRDNYSISYIINPNKETSFLVFGVSL